MLPLTPTQRRLLREQAVGLGPRPLVSVLELDGRVDVDRLDASWREVQGRHPFLRLRVRGGAAHAADGVRALHRGVLPGSTRGFEDAVWSVICAAGRPRDLGTEGPAEAVWLQTGPEAGLLVCGIDHVAVDGFALSLVAREWAALYRGERPDPPPDVAPLADQFDGAAHRATFAGAAERLREQFRGASSVPCPAPGPPWMWQQVDVPRSLADGLRAASRSRRASPAVLGLAALGRALHHELDASDVVVSTHVANRSLRGSERVVLACYGTAPVRVRPERIDDLESWVQAAREGLLAALSRQHLPLVDAHRVAGVELLDVMLNVDEHPFMGFSLPGVYVRDGTPDRARPIADDPRLPRIATSPVPWPGRITASVRESWECVQVFLHYDRGLVDRAATRMLGRLIEGLALLADTTTTKPGASDARP